MAITATVRAGLSIRDSAPGGKQYSSPRQQFTATVTSGRGPSPGTVIVTEEGVDIDLSVLDAPSLYRVENISSTATITMGIRDPETDLFYPWRDLKPTEFYVDRFAAALFDEYEGTGTGGATGTNKVHARSSDGDAELLLEAFDE